MIWNNKSEAIIQFLAVIIQLVLKTSCDHFVIRNIEKPILEGKNFVFKREIIFFETFRTTSTFSLIDFVSLDFILVFDLFSDLLLCRGCGNDITSSQQLINTRISSHAEYAKNETLFNKSEVLVQSLQNPHGLSFKVILVHEAECTASASDTVSKFDETSHQRLESQSEVKLTLIHMCIT